MKTNEVQEPRAFDLLLFWEEARVALDQGMACPPKAGLQGDRLREAMMQWPLSVCACRARVLL